MFGHLPTTLNVNDKDYRIRTDFREILKIVSAYNDDTLTDKEKVYVCMRQIYIDLFDMPTKDYETAYKKAIDFIECNNQSKGKPGPKIVNWDKDEQLLFPAINKVAGCEVRAMPYTHWWTFLGYFHSIDPESTYGFILQIRQKKVKNKKLEKHELAFYNANREICEVSSEVTTRAKADKKLASIYADLLKEGD